MKPMKKLIASLTVMASLAVVAPQAMAGAVYHHWSETPAEVQATHSPEVLQSYIDAYWVNELTNAYPHLRPGAWAREETRKIQDRLNRDAGRTPPRL